jgi:hypothetical protein
MQICNGGQSKKVTNNFGIRQANPKQHHYLLFLSVAIFLTKPLVIIHGKTDETKVLGVEIAQRWQCMCVVNIYVVLINLL